MRPSILQSVGKFFVFMHGNIWPQAASFIETNTIPRATSGVEPEAYCIKNLLTFMGKQQLIIIIFKIYDC